MTSFTQYPLVQKALTEQQAIFAGSAEGLPADLEAATTRALTLIDAHVKTSDAEREALLTVCVLMHCPPYMALKSRRFTADYNAHVQAMLDTHTRGGGITDANKDLVQVYSAMFIAHAENLQRIVAAMPALNGLWLRDMRESLTDYAADRMIFVKSIAPGLRAVEDVVISDTLAILDRHLADLQPKRHTTKSSEKAPRPPKR